MLTIKVSKQSGFTIYWIEALMILEFWVESESIFRILSWGQLWLFLLKTSKPFTCIVLHAFLILLNRWKHLALINQLHIIFSLINIIISPEKPYKRLLKSISVYISDSPPSELKLGVNQCMPVSKDESILFKLVLIFMSPPG